MRLRKNIYSAITDPNFRKLINNYNEINLSKLTSYK
jgi:hypothetical protein